MTMTAHNDDQITGEIIAAFAANPNIHVTEIRVQVRRGVVYLQGVVETLKEKALADQASLAIQGVRRVENDLTVSADRDLRDAEIERVARAALDGAGFGFIGANVEVGSACLVGVAESEAVVRHAMECVAAVPGVRGVCTAVEIAGARPMDDIGLADQVAETLSDDPRLEFLDLEVRSEDGNVVLTGYILNADQFDTATELVESTPGVRSVENRMVLQEAPTA
jgi:osmotically-inducible protein OsmY